MLSPPSPCLLVILTTSISDGRYKYLLSLEGPFVMLEIYLLNLVWVFKCAVVRIFVGCMWEIGDFVWMLFDLGGLFLGNWNIGIIFAGPYLGFQICCCVHLYWNCVRMWEIGNFM